MTSYITKIADNTLHNIFDYSDNINVKYVCKFFYKINNKKKRYLYNNLIKFLKLNNIKFNEEITFNKFFLKKYYYKNKSLNYYKYYQNTDKNMKNFNILYLIDFYNKIKKGHIVIFSINNENILKIGILCYKTKKHCYIYSNYNNINNTIYKNILKINRKYVKLIKQY